MTIVEVTPLNFGDVSVDALIPGSVTMTPAGVRSALGGATAVPGGSEAVGAYTLGGVALKTYSISIPAINLQFGSINLAATFTNNAIGTLPAATEAIGVGGTISLIAGQTPGLYQGDYTITVDYN